MSRLFQEVEHLVFRSRQNEIAKARLVVLKNLKIRNGDIYGSMHLWYEKKYFAVFSMIYDYIFLNFFCDGSL